MARDLKSLTNFLLAIGIGEIAHSEKTYLAHLVGVYRDLEAWGCDEDVCRAGMFHSIYGTQLFQGFKLPFEQRGEVRQLIGDRAERLAHLNCVVDRSSLDRAAAQDSDSYRIIDRVTEQEVELPRRDFDDLCRVHLCDWLEQVPRSKNWDYRRQGYAHMARRLGGVAEEAFERVFGNAPVQGSPVSK